MPDDRNPKNQRPYQPGATTDSVRIVEDSIRHAFLTHMGEQQRQFAVIAVRRASVRDTEREMGKRARSSSTRATTTSPRRKSRSVRSAPAPRIANRSGVDRHRLKALAVTVSAVRTARSMVARSIEARSSRR